MMGEEGIQLVVQVRCSADKLFWPQTASCFLTLVSQIMSPFLAGRIVSLVVVPGVLVAVAAILWLLEMNHKQLFIFSKFSQCTLQK